MVREIGGEDEDGVGDDGEFCDRCTRGWRNI